MLIYVRYAHFLYIYKVYINIFINITFKYNIYFSELTNDNIYFFITGMHQSFFRWYFLSTCKQLWLFQNACAQQSYAIYMKQTGNDAKRKYHP